MRLFKKLILKNNNKKIKIFFIAGIAILIKKKTSSYEKTYFLNKLVRYKKNQPPIFSLSDLFSETSEGQKNNGINQTRQLIAELLYLNNSAICTEVWFDHSWGGGAEYYTLNEFNLLKKNTLCIRIQNSSLGQFKITYYYQDAENYLLLKGAPDTLTLLGKLSIQGLVVNNLAGYKNPLKLLSEIAKIKEQSNAKVSFRGHDFFSICPTINMINDNNEYCNCYSCQECELCPVQFSEFERLKSGSIMQWQRTWYNFFMYVVDEVILFSNSTYDIYTRFYPCLKNKIKIVPHSITPLRRCNIQSHENINIAVLGSIGSIHKGALVLKEMVDILEQYHRVEIKIVGTLTQHFKIKSKHIRLLGEYKRENLPNIMEINQIDLVLIPSVCPETFSYTTSEVIAMNLPVACFNLGAQAEYVGKYEKGLIISKKDPKVILDEITNFVEKLRNI